jgi:hypothetical protein
MSIIETPTIETRNNHRIAQGRNVVDYSVHGLITIRLVDAPSSAVKAIERIMGKSQGEPSDEPDILIRFVDKMPVSGQLRYIGLNDAAFDSENFYRVDEGGRLIRIDFETLGDPCEIVCEQGVSIVPHMVQILGLRLLNKGYVLLHSGAFVYKGTGVLVTGWEKGGKTETLLPFMAAGARYLSDEWTIVSAEDGTLWGLTGMTQVWSWHLRYLPQFWARIKPFDRFRIRMVRLYQVIYRALPAGLRGRGIFAQWFYRLSLEGGVALVGQSRSAPELLFRDQIWQGPAPMDRLFLATLGQGETRILPVDPDEIAHRMVSSLAYERRTLWHAYQQFRFAFPERRNDLLESSREREMDCLLQAFGGRSAFEIRHPYPVDLPALFRAVVPYIAGDSV